MHKKGKTVTFADPPVITGHAGVAGKKEGEGPTTLFCGRCRQRAKARPMWILS